MVTMVSSGHVLFDFSKSAMRKKNWHGRKGFWCISKPFFDYSYFCTLIEFS